MAACSGSDDSQEATSAAHEAKGTYPQEYDTPYGSTTLDAEPQRIAVASDGDLELVVALGLVPVVAQAYDDSGNPGLPGKFRDYLGDRADEVEIVYAYGEEPYEAIAEADIDAIIATQDYSLEQNFDKFAAIAPVVSIEETIELSPPWQDRLRLVGKALNRMDEAEAAIEDAEQTITDVKAEHPEFEGRSISLLIAEPDGKVRLQNYPGSATEELLNGLGFVSPSGATGVSAESPSVSQERVGDLEADIVLVTDPETGDQEYLVDFLESTAFRQLSAVKNGAWAQPDSMLVAYLAFPGPLYTQWALDGIVPQLADVVDGG